MLQVVPTMYLERSISLVIDEEDAANSGIYSHGLQAVLFHSIDRQCTVLYAKIFDFIYQHIIYDNILLCTLLTCRCSSCLD